MWDKFSIGRANSTVLPNSFSIFLGAFHGRTFGALSCTHSKPIHKVDIPAFQWPIADYPRYKYPLASNQRDNAAEDQRCLAQVSFLSKFLSHGTSMCMPCLQFETVLLSLQVEDILTSLKGTNKEVAGILVEPIQSEGGDHHGSPEFLQGLRKITKKVRGSYCHFLV